MNKLKLSIPIALGSLFLSGNLVRAAETTPATPTPPSATTPATPDLEQRMRQLEDRIRSLETRNHELESELENRRPDSDATLRQYHDRMKRDFSNNFDDMFDQMRRELEQGGFNFQFGPNGQMVPPNFGGPGAPGFGPNFGATLNEKPRLGVQLSPITDQLRERYKNDAKQGAFVIAVVPNSPAEKAGVQVGDAITKVAGKDVATPDAAIDAIRNAPTGKLDLTVLRQNKEQTLTPELQAEESSEETLPPSSGNRWLRRGDLNRGGGMSGSGANNGNSGAANLNNGNVHMQTELKASALELPDDLAKTLKLSDEQRKKMGDILQKQAQAASEEAAADNQPRTNARGGLRGFNLRMGGDVSRIVDKHVTEAEGELKGVLSDEQMHDWKQWRQTHNSVEFSHSMRIESGDTAPNNTSSGGTLGF